MAQQDPTDDHITRTYVRSSSILSQNSTLTGANKDSGVFEPFPTIPHYEVIAELGRGGMGDVFLVKDADGNRFALKMVRRDRVSGQFIERFTREKQALLDLHHRHVIRIYHVGKTTDGSPYFVMRYVENGSLHQNRAKYQADARKSIEMVIAVAEAVDYLHQNSQIHRDLKPHNILVDADGTPYVSDFGLVKNLDAVEAEESLDEGAATPALPGDRPTLTIGAIGTLPYMSPEQLRGEARTIGPQTDIYALGVILYELLSGRQPFESPSNDELRTKIRTESPQPLQVPRVSKEIKRIVMKCLAKEPTDRYGSAAELATDLRAHQAPQPNWPARIAILLLIPFLVAAALLLLDRPTAPKKRTLDDRREALIQQLRPGNIVTLVGAEGLPDYYETIVGDDDSKVFKWNGNGPMTVSTQSYALVQMVPAGACPTGFKMHGFVRMNQGHVGEGRGGFFRGYNIRHPDNGPRHYFGDLGIEEFLPDSIKIEERDGKKMAQRTGRWSFTHRELALFPANTQSGELPWVTSSGSYISPVPLPDSDEWWRELTLVVTPKDTKVFFGDEPRKIEDNAKCVAFISKMLVKAWRPVNGPPLSFGPEMPAGFFIQQASVSFRSVTIEVLPENDP